MEEESGGSYGAEGIGFAHFHEECEGAVAWLSLPCSAGFPPVRHVLTGWDTAVGLQKSHEKWEDRVKRLTGRLTAHKEQLHSTATILGSTDVGIHHTIQRPQSKLSGL
ncbi:MULTISPECIES: hypothetical protein [Streptomyces]|uniref:Excreted virulence factor EspC, type VII ESX diderm n=1 Tax=Streptomyces sudanensis TaxID=436397 RepID=A0ABY4TES6_9ACTN|nr:MULTISPECIES: hypothetical protein [Streptomyces]MCP9958820.1 hypothetical protein [Streptomyces sudanensis]MCQ0000699.1 hypothetical protein [Streptomyces sudanensis]URN16283.1 hypothetical protein MW084_10340 [Streptomyces sudanensis]